MVGTSIAPAHSVPILFMRKNVCSGESNEEPDPEFATKFGLLVGKLNACLNHLEQFPIKVSFLTKRTLAAFFPFVVIRCIGLKVVSLIGLS
jgi:hypothetical protein